MLKKNDVIITQIIDVGSNGEGIAKHEGVVIFVPFAYINEEVKIQIINTKSKFYVAKLLEVLKPSENRVEPKCPIFGKCGGCQLQHISYSEQLKFKTNLVENCLKRIAKIDANVFPCVASANEYAYRNKLQMPVGENSNGFVIGMYAPLSHRIISTNNCCLQNNLTNSVIECVNEFMNKFRISGYNKETKTGLIRHIVARSLDDKILVTFVINGKEMPKIDEFIAILKKKFSNFGVFVNINTKSTNVILGEKFIHAYGLTELSAEENGIKFSVVPQSFMQINETIKSKIYNQVFDLIKEEKPSVVIDAYSGAGLLSAEIAKIANKVVGIEIVSEAVSCANTLAKENNLTNLENIAGDCAVVLPSVASGTKTKNFCIVLDPPRKGCDEKVINAILKSLPKSIIYVSCAPSTLARDLQLLKESYEIKLVQPYDMFPQTSHVETLVFLTKKEGK